MQRNKTAAAGFILFRSFNGVYKMLCLWDKDGRGDTPKGRCDDKDVNIFHTAQRECFEETSIMVAKNDVISQETLFLNKRLTLFCAITDQDVEIRQNPESGKYEHLHFEWVCADTFQKMLPDYLKPAIPWGNAVLEQYLTLDSEGY